MLSMKRVTCQSYYRQILKARKKKELEHTLLLKTIIEEVVDVDAPLPHNIQEVLGGSESQEWLKAIIEELENLNQIETWKMEELTKGREAVGCGWVFSRKKAKKGNIICYKTQLGCTGLFAQTRDGF